MTHKCRFCGRTMEYSFHWKEWLCNCPEYRDYNRKVGG